MVRDLLKKHDTVKVSESFEKCQARTWHHILLNQGTQGATGPSSRLCQAKSCEYTLIVLCGSVSLTSRRVSHRVPASQEVAAVKGLGQWPMVVVALSPLSAQMAQSVVALRPLLSVAVTVQATRPSCVGPMLTPVAVTLESQVPSRPLCCLLVPTRQLRQTRLSVSSVAGLQRKTISFMSFQVHVPHCDSKYQQILTDRCWSDMASYTSACSLMIRYVCHLQNITNALNASRRCFLKKAPVHMAGLPSNGNESKSGAISIAAGLTGALCYLLVISSATSFFYAEEMLTSHSSWCMPA